MTNEDSQEAPRDGQTGPANPPGRADAPRPAASKAAIPSALAASEASQRVREAMKVLSASQAADVSAKFSEAIKPALTSHAFDASKRLSEVMKSVGTSPAFDASKRFSEVMKSVGTSPAMDAFRGSSAASQAMATLGKSPALEAARESAAASNLLKALGATAAPQPSPLMKALADPVSAPTQAAPLPLPDFRPTPIHRVTPMRWRRWLLKRVGQLDAHLRRRHEGAWDAVGHGGPDAVSQAAGSLVELIKGVIRQSTDPDEVLSWLDSRGRPPWGYDSNGHPTRRARTEYLLLQQGVPRRSASAYALALSETAKDLEAIKHGSSDGTMRFVGGSLLLFEALLVVSSSSDPPARGQSPLQ